MHCVTTDSSVFPSFGPSAVLQRVTAAPCRQIQSLIPTSYQFKGKPLSIASVTSKILLTAMRGLTSDTGVRYIVYIDLSRQEFMYPTRDLNDLTYTTHCWIIHFWQRVWEWQSVTMSWKIWNQYNMHRRRSSSPMTQRSPVRIFGSDRCLLRAAADQGVCLKPSGPVYHGTVFINYSQQHGLSMIKY